MSQVQVENVYKTFPLEAERVSAVQGVSLSLDRGEFISIVGHSGSGKTTLLSMLGGILKPTKGRIVVNDNDIYAGTEQALSAYRALSVGYIFQFASLMPVLTAKENLLLPGLFTGKGVDAAYEERALELLSLVGLADKAGAYPPQLSGGQQRRVAIARAFMNRPELILADEPTGDLDEQTEAEIMTLLKRLNAEGNITFVLVTHNSELAAQAQRRFRMQSGTIEEMR